LLRIFEDPNEGKEYSGPNKRGKDAKGIDVPTETTLDGCGQEGWGEEQLASVQITQTEKKSEERRCMENHPRTSKSNTEQKVNIKKGRRNLAIGTWSAVGGRGPKEEEEKGNNQRKQETNETLKPEIKSEGEKVGGQLVTESCLL